MLVTRFHRGTAGLLHGCAQNTSWGYFQVRKLVMVAVVVVVVLVLLLICFRCGVFLLVVVARIIV